MEASKVTCLYCKKETCITDPDKIEKTSENIIIRPLICRSCGKSWKDFYGADNESSPVISIQRNSSTDNDK